MEKKEIINYDYMINPEKRFREIKYKLLKLYLEDYSKDNYQKIKDNMKNTIYIFDSIPLYKMLFIEKNYAKITSCKKITEIEEEYYDYLDKVSEIDIKIQKEYLKNVRELFNTDTKKLDYDFVINLPFDSYSSWAKELLLDEHISEDKKLEILKSQDEYHNKCHELGLTPVTDTKKIDSLLQLEEILENLEHEELLRKTIWGKKILRKAAPLNINISDLAELIFDDTAATTSFIRYNDKTDIICYCPVIKNSYLGSLDSILLHENRHVIEANNMTTGLVTEDGEYNILNEIRTELNAKEDNKLFLDEPIFSNSKMKGTNYNAYNALVPFTSNFFSKHKDILNSLAITSNISELERLFGKNNLLEFDKYLSILERYNEINERKLDSSIINKNKQKQLVRKLEDSYFINK